MNDKTIGMIVFLAGMIGLATSVPFAGFAFTIGLLMLLFS